MYVQKIIRKSGTTAYRAVVKSKGRVIATKIFDKQTHATSWAKRLEDDRVRVSALGSTIGQAKFTKLCDLSVAWWKTQERKDKTQPQRVDWWRARQRNTRVADVTADEVRQALNNYAIGRKLATVNRHKACLGAIYKFAQQEHGLPASINPSREVATRPENNHHQRYLSDAERGRLLTTCRQSEYTRLYLLDRTHCLTSPSRA